jgi:hypothetical protein
MKYIVAILLLVITFEVKSEDNNILSFERQYLLDKSVVNALNVISPQVYKNDLFYLYNHGVIEHDSCVITLYRTTTPPNDTTIKQIIKVPAYNNRPYFADFYVNDSTLIIVEYKTIYFLKRDGNAYRLYQTVFSRQGNKELKVINNTAYIYNFTPNLTNTNEDILIKRISLDKFETDSFCIKSPKGIEFMLFQPRKILDINSKFIAVACPNEYSISIYDKEDGKEINKIERNTGNWKSVDRLLPDSVWRKEPHKFFKFMVNKIKSISLMQKIFFLDSTRLLAVWWQPLDSQRSITNYDLWELKNNKWVFSMSNQFDTYPQNDSAYTPDTYIHNNLNVKNDFPYILLDFPFQYQEFLGKSNKYMKDKIENYYIDNDPRLSVFVWRKK